MKTTPPGSGPGRSSPSTPPTVSGPTFRSQFTAELVSSYYLISTYRTSTLFPRAGRERGGAIEMRGYKNLPVRRGNDPEPLPTLRFRRVAVEQQLSLLARLSIPRLPDDVDVPLVGDPVTTRVSVRPYTSSRKWSVILMPCTFCSSPRLTRRLGSTKQSNPNSLLVR